MEALDDDVVVMVVWIVAMEPRAEGWCGRNIDVRGK